jgi:hypothetical protein
LLVGGAGPETAHLILVTVATGKRLDLVPPNAGVEYRVLDWSSAGNLIAYTRRSSNAASGPRLELFVNARPPPAASVVAC